MAGTISLAQALLAIGTGVMVAVGILGSGAWWWQKGWRELAEVRGENIKELEKEIADLKTELEAARAEATAERDGLRVQMAQITDRHTQDQHLMTARIEALEGQVAFEQRQNHRLQLRLDEAEKKLNGGEKKAG